MRVVAGGSELCHWRGPTLVIGAGKAAARMAAGCEQALDGHDLDGEVIVADGCEAVVQHIIVSAAGHPLPDARGEAATRRLIDRVARQDAGGILFLIGGGASSLLVCPRPPLRLADKIATTRLLLECGASIDELNTVRKHLSAVKGGGLLRQLRVPAATLIISDVIGDDPATIGSGPTTPDVTTFAQTWAIFERYGLTSELPAVVVNLVDQGRRGQGAETLKPTDPEAARARNLVIGSNRIALEGAAHAARARGWEVRVAAAPLLGDTTVAAGRFVAWVREVARHSEHGPPRCLLAGGETTVQVRGTGRGGRNQEFALAMAEDLAGTEVSVLSAGTDGIDGPTDAAGAFVDGTTLTRARARGLDAAAALAANDSYRFFSQLGDLLQCGPTGTNVMDLKIALVPAPGPC